MALEAGALGDGRCCSRENGVVMSEQPVVVAVSRDGEHRFSKAPTQEIVLLAGLGVQGDAHAGATVQHRFDAAVDPTRPNLRQVHLIHSELLSELSVLGFAVAPGDLGENITTAGLELLVLPRGTLLHIGAQAVVEVTGLRTPCAQINGFQPGLLKAVLGRSENGEVVRRAGIMGVVIRGGPVRPADAIDVRLPAGPHQSLEGV